MIDLSMQINLRIQMLLHQLDMYQMVMDQYIKNMVSDTPSYEYDAWYKHISAINQSGSGIADSFEWIWGVYILQMYQIQYIHIIFT